MNIQEEYENVLELQNSFTDHIRNDIVKWMGYEFKKELEFEAYGQHFHLSYIEKGLSDSIYLNGKDRKLLYLSQLSLLDQRRLHQTIFPENEKTEL